MIDIHLATPDDWVDLKKLHENFLKSSHSSRLDISLPTLQTLFSQGLLDPSVGVIVARDSRQSWQPLRGVAVVQLRVEQWEDQKVLRTFLRGVYICPQSDSKVGQALNEFIDSWALVRGCDMVLANVRLGGPGKNGFKHRAAMRQYGYEPLYTMIGKRLTKEESSNG